MTKKFVKFTFLELYYLHYNNCQPENVNSACGTNMK